ncbi:hypothetical protein AHF37_02561 [Paragonimus kellicotti]|nr:hypothetical protein AHF37_02561 [Paragonimus kellicotti]
MTLISKLLFSGMAASIVLADEDVQMNYKVYLIEYAPIYFCCSVSNIAHFHKQMLAVFLSTDFLTTYFIV